MFWRYSKMQLFILINLKEHIFFQNSIKRQVFRLIWWLGYRWGKMGWAKRGVGTKKIKKLVNGINLFVNFFINSLRKFVFLTVLEILAFLGFKICSAERSCVRPELLDVSAEAQSGFTKLRSGFAELRDVFKEFRIRSAEVVCVGAELLVSPRSFKMVPRS